MKNIILAISFVFFLSIFSDLKAQEADSIKSPKIGLVLSGGGAKGLAHIGVLKVLEEAGIRPDYITGTSMGSIIGGLYALGYSAEEISQLNANADWEKLLSDRIALNKIVMEEKYESRRYLFSFPIRDYKFKLPSGLIEGQQLESFFGDIVWPLHEQESFDKFPIPFHCMAVDIISGETIEFDSGNFVEAIRASMSIPSVFAPKDIDTLLLVDGGISKNFPVEEVRKMGAEYVIGVYVGFSENVNAEDLFSLTDVLSRATSLEGINDAKEQLKNVDLLIIPDLKGYGASDFAKAQKIEKIGEEAARQKINELKETANKLNLRYSKIEKVEQNEKILISEIAVENTRFMDEDFVIGQSGLKINTQISNKEMNAAIDKIYGTQYFKKVSYRLLKKPDDSYKLIFKLKEKTRALLNIAPSFDNQVGVGVVTNLTLRNYIVPSSHLIASFNIAENPAFRFDFNKYIGNKQHLIAHTFFNLYKNELPFYVESFDMGQYSRTYMDFGLGLKYSISLNQQIGIKAFYENNGFTPHENLKNYISEPDLEFYGITGYSMVGNYTVNTTDDIYFPRKGLKLDIQYKYSFSQDANIRNSLETINQDIFSADVKDYGNMYFNIDWFMNPLNPITINLGSTVSTSSSKQNMSRLFMIGGSHLDSRTNYIPFAGLSFGEVMSQNVAILRGGIDIEVFSNFYLSVNANMGIDSDTKQGIIDYIKESPLKSYMKGVSGGIKYNSIIGPVQLMIADNDMDNTLRWYFSLGFPF